jgi:hypothetical protein
MKLRYILSISAAVLLTFTACSHKKSDADKLKDDIKLYQKQPEMQLSTNDTNAVMDLTKQFLEQVKSRNINGAMSMLHYMNKKKEVVDVPTDLAKQERMALQAFPIFAYRIDFIKFYRETDSEIGYSLLIQDPAKVKKPGVIKAMIRPIRRNGKWYLTLADSKTDTIQSELDNY